MTDVSTSRSTSAGVTQRIRGLDVLRGVAVLLVMLRHAAPGLFGGAGVIGVVMFFTLSGFLITGVIDREVQRTGRFSFGRFYRNRALRLLPALFLVLLVFMAITITFDPMRDRALIVGTLVLALTYTIDLPLGVRFSRSLGHLWTLAVEEQFYLIWPSLFIFARRRNRVGAVLAGAVLVTWLAAVGTVVLFHDRVFRLYQLPTSWAVTLLIGSAAYIFRDRIDRLIPRGWTHPAAAVAGVLLLAAVFSPDANSLALTYLIGGPVVAVCTVFLVRSALTWDLSRVPVLLPLFWLGTISYGTYLWNYFLVNLLEGTGPDVLPLGTALAVIPLTVAAATVSWLLVERPALAWKVRLDRRARSRMAAATNRRP